MTTLTLCPEGWRLYDAWDELCSVSHELTAEETEQENKAWVEYQDHKNSCPECWKGEI